jgi:DNA-binding GntR family transcriptional regulator
MKPKLRTIVKSLPDQIAESIAASVIRGELLPGASIREQLIADTFQVSRASVREALRILERDGVVEIRARRGARVTKLTEAEMVEIYQIRQVLFGLTASLFAQERSNADLAWLRDGLRQMKAIKEMTDETWASHHGQLSADMARRLIEQSRNQRLVRLMLQMSMQIARYTILGLSSPARRGQSIANWTRLIAAIAKQDSDAAEVAARQMVGHTLEFARKQLAQRDSASAGRES